MTKTKKKRTPREARTENAISELRRDNWDVRGHWMLLAPDHVTIAKQEKGEAPEYVVQIPRSVFEAFIRAYDTGSTRKVNNGL